MRIADVLTRKGDTVVTISPDSAVRALLALLAEHGIGAVVVSADGHRVAGIVSERDVVRGLHASGDAVLDGPVSAIMTADVHTCSPGDTVEDLMETMTARRFRHVPVVEDGVLVGIMSIGDVVKRRLELLQVERDQLSAYISG
ncbi:CBS domain-containing protein [Isoptericola sp. b441]|uniref:CBS domain-containing protein n=1 Tax=Actinotalea lenta TaxID=3064654 RepID=A0ABT9D512_9CELL|nr:MULTISPECIES: CBS domain-containing protein [unclassified Isoptericola]MDO8105824.1 CBS domain-containing protein [Isoptericola sp. b441]MDO8122529.1 CBS domain-containing protein [Isoptericola sp. b490]